MASKSAVPSHLKAGNGGAEDRHHGKTQSHVVCIELLSYLHSPVSGR